MTASEAAASAERILARCAALALHSEVAGETTRPFLCPSVKAVQQLVREWMEAAGLTVRMDGMGNLRGESTPPRADAPRLLIGSHLDTVPNAGAFDGILGVMLAIEAAETLREGSLPFVLEVLAFSEEEGVRFGRPFLGSLAVVGRAAETLAWTDRDGISVAQALAEFGVDPTAPTVLAPETTGYLEVHIEQGPVLESLNQSLAVVDAIAGQSRYTVQFHGRSNHAGTTPMTLRQDALAAAAEWIVSVEDDGRSCAGLVATVGRIEAHPGAGNIIPGHVSATLDVRHRDDATRTEATLAMLDQARAAAAKRNVTVTGQLDLDQGAVTMDPGLSAHVMRAAADATGRLPPRLTSGAGHDAMILAGSVPAAMLFVRSPGGLSHHPDESVLGGDVADALATVVRFLRTYNGMTATPTTELTHA